MVKNILLNVSENFTEKMKAASAFAAVYTYNIKYIILSYCPTLNPRMVKSSNADVTTMMSIITKRLLVILLFMVSPWLYRSAMITNKDQAKNFAACSGTCLNAGKGSSRGRHGGRQGYMPAFLQSKNVKPPNGMSWDCIHGVLRSETPKANAKRLPAQGIERKYRRPPQGAEELER
jgi:hypothetical protein